jgi:AraC-like DNA-binding protein
MARDDGQFPPLRRTLEWLHRLTSLPSRRRPQMDALSDVLRVIRLTGGVFLEGNLTAPWCVTSHVEPEDCRPHLSNTAAVISFHYVISGRMHVAVDGEPPLEVGSDTIVLLPRNDPHTLASGPGLPAVDPTLLIHTDLNGALATIVYGGGGDTTRIVCGFVGSESRDHPLFSTLPRLLAMNLAGKPGADWIARSFQHAAHEVAAGRPAAGTVLAKLSELLFVEALREYAEGLPAERTGWLAALRDPAIGRALACMHTRIAHPWTTEDLAAEALLSRSAFAERFTQLLDAPPMTYLTRWRMQVAAQQLRETQRSIAQIAWDVGYESEATFTRAFKREIGSAPGRYRRGTGPHDTPLPA